MTISPYQQQIVDPTYIKPPKYNLELELKVLQHKQDTYNNRYKHIQNLKKQALSIDFINENAGAEIDNFNKEISQKFAGLKGDFGDLSNSNISNAYIDMFSKFQNSELIDVFKKEKKYRNQLGLIEKMKTSKKPGEAGYNNINEMVYRMDLKEYASKPVKEAKDYTVDDYVPYTNIQKLQQEAILKIPDTELEYEVVDPNTGRKTIIKTKKKVGAREIAAQIVRDNHSQVKVNSKYLKYTGMIDDPKQKSQIINTYNSQVNNQLNLVNKALEETNAKYKNDQTNPEFLEIRQRLQNQKASLKQYDINSITDDEYLGIVENNYMQELIDGSVKAFAPESKSVTTELDPVYKFYKEQALSWTKHRAEQEYRNQKLQIDRDNLAIKLMEQGVKMVDGKAVVDENMLFANAVNTPSQNTPNSATDFINSQKEKIDTFLIGDTDFNKQELKIDGTAYAKDMVKAVREQAIKDLEAHQNSYRSDLSTNQQYRRDFTKTTIDLKRKINNPEEHVADKITKSQIIAEVKKNKSNAFINDIKLFNHPQITALREVYMKSPNGVEFTDEELWKKGMDILKDSTSTAYARNQEITNFKHSNEAIRNRVENASFEDRDAIIQELNSLYAKGMLEGEITPGKRVLTAPSKGDDKATSKLKNNQRAYAYNELLNGMMGDTHKIGIDDITSVTRFADTGILSIDIDTGRFKDGETITLGTTTIQAGTGVHNVKVRSTTSPLSNIPAHYTYNGTPRKHREVDYWIRSPQPGLNYFYAEIQFPGMPESLKLNIPANTRPEKIEDVIKLKIDETLNQAQ